MRFPILSALVSLLTLLIGFSLHGQTPPPELKPEIKFAAPGAQGNGSATSAENAADYLDPDLWKYVSTRLEKTPVTIKFVDGDYKTETLILMKIGHPDHLLLLEPVNPGGAVFKGDLKWQIRLRGSQNITLRNLHFTGPTRNFALHIRSETGYPAHNLTVESCQFIDLDKATYGAIGISGEVTELLVQKNTFKRVGYDAHAHMVYTTYGGFGPGPLRFLNNHFEDSSGDYLRLRNRIGYTEIIGNTFISNSIERNRPFIAMPIFSTKDPSTSAISDDVVIRKNTFRYHPWKKQDWDRAITVCLSSYGYDPDDRHYLLLPEQAEIVRSGPVEESRKLFTEVTKINLKTIRLSGNTFENAFYHVGFGAFAHFDAKSRGWEGFIDITRLVNQSIPRK